MRYCRLLQCSIFMTHIAQTPKKAEAANMAGRPPRFSFYGVDCQPKAKASTTQLKRPWTRGNDLDQGLLIVSVGPPSIARLTLETFFLIPLTVHSYGLSVFELQAVLSDQAPVKDASPLTIAVHVRP